MLPNISAVWHAHIAHILSIVLAMSADSKLGLPAVKKLSDTGTFIDTNDELFDSLVPPKGAWEID